MAQIKDVAKQAGVSVASLSRVLAGHAGVVAAHRSPGSVTASGGAARGIDGAGLEREMERMSDKASSVWLSARPPDARPEERP